MNRTTYLYILYDPTFISPKFYVGYSYNPSKRLEKHISRKNENKTKDEWIDELKQRGVSPSYFIVSVFSSDYDAGRAEIEMIAFCHLIGIDLVNKALGGNKPPRMSCENSALSKLIWDDINIIRKRYFDDLISLSVLAREYKVTRRTITNIVNYKTWTDNIIIPTNLEELLQQRREYGTSKRRSINDITIQAIRHLFLYENKSRAQIYVLYPQFSHSQLDKIIANRAHKEKLDISTQSLLEKRLKEESARVNKERATTRSGINSSWYSVPKTEAQKQAVSKANKGRTPWNKNAGKIDQELLAQDLINYEEYRKTLIVKQIIKSSSRLKTTYEDVLKIRYLHSLGRYSPNKLSKIFNLSGRYINDIVNKKCWNY